MKKIIPAIAMTLLGASLLGTSTYAWFSANTSATAEGLNIKAQASSSLLISNEEGGPYASKATLSDINNVTNKVVDPITKGVVSGQEASTTSQDFIKLHDDSKAYVLSNGTIDPTKTPVYVAATANDIVKSTVYLKYSGKDAYHHVSASITISNASPSSDEIWKSIHVAFYEAGTANQVGAIDTETSKHIDFQVAELGVESDVQDLGEISTTAEWALDVYVWIEGNDAACFNSNALNGDLYGISCSFNLVNVDPSSH